MVIEKKRPFDGVKSFFGKIGKRNLFIALAVVLIGAVAVNWIVFAETDDKYSGYDVSSGMSNIYGDNSSQTGSDDFFAATQVSRARARDEAREVLQSVVDDESADAAAKSAAYESMQLLAKQMDDEANIESLIKAKGFEECVAVINGDKANIVVKSEGLRPNQLSQILEIVYLQADILPANVTISEK